jgi:diguanylate cyclase (GGDEF)-like protein
MLAKEEMLHEDFKGEIDSVLKEVKDKLYGLYDLATLDIKTGIYNHHFFLNTLTKEIERVKRHDHSFSVAMIDVDFFKKINDNYGHLIGDVILIELVKNIKTSLRKYDIFARYGGEEFSLILPYSKGDNAVKVCDRIRKGLPKNKKLKKYNITISIGVTSYQPKDTAKKMIHRADKALYRAKKEGRNRVIEG